MDNTIVIVAILALVIGAIIATVFLLPKKNKKKIIEQDNSQLLEKEEELRVSQNELLKQRKKVEQLNTEIQKYSKQIETLKSISNHKNQPEEFNHIRLIDVSNLENEIERLKKEIEEYEERLDDAEFDADDFRKKFNKKREEFDELENNFYSLEKQKKEITEKLNEYEEKLHVSEEKLSNKTESLSIINEILSAKSIDKSSDKNKKKISEIEDFVNDRILVELKGFNEIDQAELKNYKNGIWKWANLQRKTWINNKKTIAFVGEFSAGKTSIINKLLSQGDENAHLLSVASKATTAIPTYISDGVSFKSEFTTPSGELKSISESVFKQITKETLETVRVSSAIQYFVLSQVNPNLKGLSILDTPGFNSNDKEDEQRTSDVIKETDVLFWVVDANTGEINKTSIRIIKEKLEGHPLYIVINKSDTKSPPELEQLQNHIEKTINQANIPVKGYLKFSQKHDVQELLDIISKVPTNPSKQDYLKIIYKKLVEEVKEAETDYFSFKREIINLNKEINSLKSKIRIKQRDIAEKAQFIKGIPDKGRKILGIGADYTITKNNYYKLSTGLNDISKWIGEFDDMVKILGVSIEKNTENSKKMDDAKEQMKKLEDLKDEFDRLIKKWDPAYFKK